MQIEKSITVPVTRETAFDYVSHLENAYEWDPAIVESRCVTSLPLGPGSRFRLMLNVGPRFLPLTYIVKEIDRPQRLVLEGWGPGFRTVDTVRFEETGEGRTLVRHHSRIRLPFGLLTEPLTRPVLAYQATRALKGLAQALETTRQQTHSPLRKMADRTVAGAVAQFTVCGWQWNKRGFRPFDRNLTGRRILVTGATGRFWFDRMVQPTHLVARTKEAPAERRHLLEFLEGVYNQKRPAEPREHARG